MGRQKHLAASVEPVDSFIAPSQAVVDYLHNEVGVPLSKVTIVHEFPVHDVSHNGDSASLRSKARAGLKLAESDFVVGMCGNIEWRKGTDLFIQLAAKLKDALPDRKLSCVWIGGDSDREDVRHDINQAGLSDVVTLLGKCLKPLEVLPAFDVFALTSREDPYPAAMLEAASASLPIVCFDKSGGPPEFVKAGQCGLIAPYLNVDAFAAHCLSLANDKSMRETLGNRARDHVRTHLIDAQAPKLFSVIEKYL
jgi:glycosyltransferase involved in cell wall biosynthesis